MGILAGILRGAGSYLVEEARAQRDAALQALREDRADIRAQTQERDRAKNEYIDVEHRGEIQQDTLSLSGKIQSEQQAAQLAHQDAAREDEQASRRELESIQHQYRLSEQNARIMLEANVAARARGEEVEWHVNEAGQMVGTVYRDGRVEEVGRTEAEYTPPGETSRGNSHGRAPRTRPAPIRPATVSPAPFAEARGGGQGGQAPANVARVGQIVRDRNGRRYRIGADGRPIPIRE